VRGRAIAARAIQGVKAALFAAGLLLAASLSATAGPAERGAAVVEQWCRLCHVHVGEAQGPDMAPPFEEIVKRPGHDEAFFVRFLHEDHFPMTTYRLFEEEKRDVVAWLMSLKGR
jgi:mono/diheme cytochrome c family protein